MFIAIRPKISQPAVTKIQFKIALALSAFAVPLLITSFNPKLRSWQTLPYLAAKWCFILALIALGQRNSERVATLYNFSYYHYHYLVENLDIQDYMEQCKERDCVIEYRGAIWRYSEDRWQNAIDQLHYLDEQNNESVGVLINNQRKIGRAHV